MIYNFLSFAFKSKHNSHIESYFQAVSNNWMVVHNFAHLYEDSSLVSGFKYKAKPAVLQVHTGLFVSCEKSNLLLGVVKRILQQKYSTKAVSGPPQPSGNCEILLQAIHDPPTGVNFPASKVISRLDRV